MESTDLFYIHPSKSLNKISYCIFPTGIISIINYLKEKGISAIGLNYPLEKCLNKNFNLQKFLSDKKFDLVAIDLHWHQHSFGAIEIANLVKKIYPKVPIVLGGYTASFFAKEILSAFKEIDFIIKGDGNIPLFQLIQNIKLNKNSYDDIPNLVYRKKNKIIESKNKFVLQNLDDLNFVDISFLNNYKYYYHTHLHYFGEKIPFFILSFASGCMYNCISCGGSKYSTENILKRNFLVRSVEKIISDIEYIYNSGIKKIWLSHDLQCLGVEKWSELFYQLRKKNIKIGLVMDIWQTLDDDFLKDFSATIKREYSALTISPISGDEDIRKEFGKLYSNEKFIESILKIKNEKIAVEVYFSYYLPNEKYKNFYQTLKMINKIRRIFGNYKLFFECKPAIFDPASILFNNPEKYNIEIIKKNFLNFYNYSKNSEFLYKISKNMIGYKLKNSNIHPLFLYILWFFEKIKILFNKSLYIVKK